MLLIQGSTLTDNRLSYDNRTNVEKSLCFWISEWIFKLCHWSVTHIPDDNIYSTRHNLL